MKTNAVKTERDFSDTVFKAVIIYDDIGNAARASASLERVVGRASETLKCDAKLWRLDALWQPTLAAITNAVATDANLIMFALNELHLPLGELLDWLERWSANRKIKDAAVALLGPEADPATPLWNELERFTRRRGLAFFGMPETWDDEGWTPGLRPQPDLDPLAAPQPVFLAGSSPATTHWGIND